MRPLPRGKVMEHGMLAGHMCRGAEEVTGGEEE